MAVDVCDVVHAEGDESPLGSAIAEAWSKADDALLEQRYNYWLNLSFYLGYQWVWWNNHTRSVDQLAGRANDDDRVHAKINLIRPRVDSLKGRLTNRPLHFECRPSAVDDATLQAAATVEQVLEARRSDDGWEEIRADTVFSMFMGASQLVMPDWDPGCSDVRLESFNIAEFTLEPGSRRPRDARWMILARALPVHQARDLYGLDWTPPTETGQESSPVQRKINLQRGLDSNVDLCVVYQFFQRPMPNRPGRVATVIDKKVVEYEDWPYPFEELPGHVFRASIVPQRWYGDTPVNDARPVQAMYNEIRSTITEIAKKVSSAKLMVPIGSLPDDDQLNDEPGQILNYIPDQGGGPKWMDPPQMPRDLRHETNKLEEDMDSILFTHATSRGQAPGDRNSGLALSILAEKDDTPLGVIARDQQTGWSKIASQTIQLYGKHVKAKRSARTTTNDAVPVSLQWDGKMLSGQSDITVPSDSVMPQSRAAMQAMLIELKQTFPDQFANIDTPTFLRLLDLRGADQLRAAMDDDVACAVYENTMIAQGEIEVPQPWHDHTRHIAEHNRERNSTRFRLASTEVKEVMQEHIDAHQRMIEEEFLQTREANSIMPGLGALPTGDETLGSLMPRDHIDGGQPPPPSMPVGPPPPV